MVFIKMLQTKTAINASGAMRNGLIWSKFLFKSNTMQPCLSNYKIPRVVQLQTIVLCCRLNARFPVHTSSPRKFSVPAARFLIRHGQDILTLFWMESGRRLYWEEGGRQEN